MDNPDAKNQSRGLWGKQEESDGKPHAFRTGEIGRSSRTFQYQQKRTDRADDTKLCTIATGGDTSSGKILETLNLLKEKHLTYIRSHRERMERQLNKNKQEEIDFLEECELLEEEILSSLQNE